MLCVWLRGTKRDVYLMPGGLTVDAEFFLDYTALESENNEYIVKNMYMVKKELEI